MEANLRSAGNMCYFIKFKHSAFEFIVFISHKKKSFREEIESSCVVKDIL